MYTYKMYDPKTLSQSGRIITASGFILTFGGLLGIVFSWWHLLFAGVGLGLISTGGILLDWNSDQQCNLFDRGITLWLPWWKRPRYFLSVKYNLDPHQLHNAHRYEQKRCEQYERFGLRGLGFYWKYMFKSYRFSLAAECFAENVRYWAEHEVYYIERGLHRYQPINYYAAVLTTQRSTKYKFSDGVREIQKWL